VSATNRTILAVFALVVLAGAFWMLLLSPRREEASELSSEVAEAKQSLSLHRGEVREALAAKREFPTEYQQLVVLGKAVPAEDDTASLLVQLNRLADHAHIRFQTFSLESASGGEEPEGGESEAKAEATASPASYPSPTEVSASLLPLGASIGPAGLAVMPYKLDFQGTFFQMADFIKGLDSLVKTKNQNVAVTGRLLTINGFTLEPDKSTGFPQLEGEFTVTTFLTPPEQGVTAGATATSPAPEATPASTTTGGTP
jgi:Tfp pilus assembly protein PilO